MRIAISDDLVVRLGNAEVALSPRAGLRLAEALARKSFRRALNEEAERAQSDRHARGREPEAVQ
jgi:hypothetical protein